tara:strand:- start:138 stop:320 length:183 start_codon:yes stop_codon:yes gene_type:complete
MSDYYFSFEIHGDALHYLCRAMDKYIEKWPGGHPDEQVMLKEIQFNLNKAHLEYQLLAED